MCPIPFKKEVEISDVGTSLEFSVQIQNHVTGQEKEVRILGGFSGVHSQREKEEEE